MTLTPGGRADSTPIALPVHTAQEDLDHIWSTVSKSGLPPSLP